MSQIFIWHRWHLQYIFLNWGPLVLDCAWAFKSPMLVPPPLDLVGNGALRFSFPWPHDVSLVLGSMAATWCITMVASFSRRVELSARAIASLLAFAISSSCSHTVVMLNSAVEIAAATRHKQPAGNRRANVEMDRQRDGKDYDNMKWRRQWVRWWNPFDFIANASLQEKFSFCSHV